MQKIGTIVCDCNFKFGELRFSKTHKQTGTWTIIRRVEENGYLKSAKIPFMIRDANYYYLTEKGLNYVGGDPRQAQPLGINELIRNYGIAAFISHTPSRQRLPKFEFAKKSEPLLGPEIISHRNYYIDADESGKYILGLAYVDHGRRAVFRLTQELKKTVIFSRLQHAVWRKAVINKGLFRIALITCNTERAKQWTEHVKSLPKKITYEIEIVPELEFLSSRTPRNPKKRQK